MTPATSVAGRRQGCTESRIGKIGQFVWVASDQQAPNFPAIVLNCRLPLTSGNPVAP